MKREVVIGQNIRALKVCSREFLADKLKYILLAFTRLCYPLSFLKKAEEIALKIYTCGRGPREKRDFLSLPSSSVSEALPVFLKREGGGGSPHISVAVSSGQKLGKIVSYRPPRQKINSNSIVYSIPCKSCPKAYVGESYRGLEKRVKEHRADVRLFF